MEPIPPRSANAGPASPRAAQPEAQSSLSPLTIASTESTSTQLDNITSEKKSSRGNSEAPTSPRHRGRIKISAASAAADAAAGAETPEASSGILVHASAPERQSPHRERRHRLSPHRAWKHHKHEKKPSRRHGGSSTTDQPNSLVSSDPLPPVSRTSYSSPPTALAQEGSKELEAAEKTPTSEVKVRKATSGDIKGPALIRTPASPRTASPRRSLAVRDEPDLSSGGPSKLPSMRSQRSENK
jgi:hypothetical protein